MSEVLSSSVFFVFMSVVFIGIPIVLNVKWNRNYMIFKGKCLRLMTLATTLGRPSRWLLFGQAQSKIKYFRQLDDKDLQSVFCNLKAEGFAEKIAAKNDRQIFGVAFSHVQRELAFKDDHLRLLNAFNFSRNMSMALFFVIIIFLYQLYMGCTEKGGECVKLADEMYGALFGLSVVTFFIISRYLHFLHTFSRHVLREYGRTASSSGIWNFDQSHP